MNQPITEDIGICRSTWIKPNDGGPTRSISYDFFPEENIVEVCTWGENGAAGAQTNARQWETANA